MKHLGQYQTLSLTKTVVIALPSEVKPELDNNDEGAHAAQKGLVIVNADHAYEPTRIRDTICHEAVHDWLDASGARALLQDALGYDEARYDAFEEQLTLKLGPAVSSSIPSLFALVGSREKVGPSIIKAARELNAARGAK